MAGVRDGVGGGHGGCERRGGGRAWRVRETGWEAGGAGERRGGAVGPLTLSSQQILQHLLATRHDHLTEMVDEHAFLWTHGNRRVNGVPSFYLTTM